MKLTHVAGVVAAALGAVAVRDLTQTKHALQRNFPVIAHARYALETIGPELRQYIVTSNDEERPFSRDQRRWIYASSKLQNNYFGFGTDDDTETTPGYAIFKHRTFADQVPPVLGHEHRDIDVPSAKVLGGPRGRAKAFRPNSFINISAMSFGSMSGNAIKALNRGAKQAGCMHNTGEGGLSPYHREGGDLILQIGTSYFGCRDHEGNFDLDKLVEVVDSAPIRAIEIKLSQGAKPGLGGLLPAAKVSREIAEIRGIKEGEDCASPSRHREFSNVDEMLDFVERIAEATGLPVGIKSAVGEMGFWHDLVDQMQDRTRGVDFVTIDGGEGGTGASPLLFSDSVALPFRMGFARVYAVFAEAGLADDVTFIASGKLGVPENTGVAFALGADMINVAREAMLAIGCIQSQKCHTDECPTGVATQNKWLERGLDPTDKGVRCGNYILAMRREMLKLCEAIGVAHPGLITPEDVEIMDGDHGADGLGEVFGYQPGWGHLGPEVAAGIIEVMQPVSGSSERPPHN